MDERSYNKIRVYVTNVDERTNNKETEYSLNLGIN